MLPRQHGPLCGLTISVTWFFLELTVLLWTTDSAFRKLLYIKRPSYADNTRLNRHIVWKAIEMSPWKAVCIPWLNNCTVFFWPMFCTAWNNTELMFQNIVFLHSIKYCIANAIHFSVILQEKELFSHGTYLYKATLSCLTLHIMYKVTRTHVYRMLACTIAHISTILTVLHT